jgi:hypothetical protein
MPDTENDIREILEWLTVNGYASWAVIIANRLAVLERELAVATAEKEIYRKERREILDQFNPTGKITR